MEQGKGRWGLRVKRVLVCGRKGTDKRTTHLEGDESMNDEPPEEKAETTPQEPEFLIQVGGAPGTGVTPQMSMEDFIKGSDRRFQEIARVVEAAGQSFVSRMNQLANKPASCSVEFGVNAGGEAGVPFVTKGTVQANFKITIQWQTETRQGESPLGGPRG